MLIWDHWFHAVLFRQPSGRKIKISEKSKKSKNTVKRMFTLRLKTRLWVCVCVCVCVISTYYCVWSNMWSLVWGYIPPVYKCIYIFKWVGPRRDLYFFRIYSFILFLHTCMFLAWCFRQRTYMEQCHVNGVLD